MSRSRAERTSRTERSGPRWRSVSGGMFEEGMDGSWGDDGIPGVDGTDGRQQKFRFCALEQVPAGTGLHGLDHRLIPVERGQRDDFGLVCAGSFGVLHDPAGGFHPVHDRHTQVHQHDVRMTLGCQGQSLLTVGGLARHFHVCLTLHQHADTRTKQGLVIDQGDGDGRPGVSHGRLLLVQATSVRSNHFPRTPAGLPRPQFLWTGRRSRRRLGRRRGWLSGLRTE